VDDCPTAEDLVLEITGDINVRALDVGDAGVDDTAGIARRLGEGDARV
jgi:hypothetical protein